MRFIAFDAIGDGACVPREVAQVAAIGLERGAGGVV